MASSLAGGLNIGWRHEGYTMKKNKVNAKGFLFAFDKETEQGMELESVVRDGDRFLKVTIGDLYIMVKQDAVEATMTMSEVKRLHKQLDELRTSNQLFMAENKRLMRQVDFLMEHM